MISDVSCVCAYNLEWIQLYFYIWWCCLIQSMMNDSIGTCSSSWLAMPENVTANFFCSCGCMARNTSKPFSFKNKFVASAAEDQTEIYG